MPARDFSTVSLVTVDEDPDTFVVGLSEDQAGEGASLILQCGVAAPDRQDKAAGLDSYCLVDEQAAVHYGGVTRASLEGDTLTLSLTAEAARVLGADDRTRTITLTVPSGDVSRLAVGLRRIFTYGDPGKQPQLVGI